MESVEYLTTKPEAGHIEYLLIEIGQNSRYIVEGNYKITYQYNDKQIIITDIFHTKQNPKYILKRNKKNK